eukprot:GHVS01000614.1.p1 GENE.GHVS01000614.1~~GHVS01000614.1.p1  ORF type:complete len:404 (+),score=49.66 GHVS01000614.1:155-1213(+)
MCLQSPVTATDTTLGDAAAALKQAEDVTNKLTDLSMFYWLFPLPEHRNPRFLDVVEKRALAVLKEPLDEFNKRQHDKVEEVPENGAVRATDVEFDNDRDKVNITLECEGKHAIVGMPVEALSMKDNEEQKQEGLFPEDVSKRVLIHDDYNYWATVIGFSGIVGGRTEVVCANLDVEKKTVANIFSVDYSPSALIAIEPHVNSLRYLINRAVTAVVKKVDCDEPLFVTTGMLFRLVTVVDAPDSDVQDAFWLRLRTFYASQLNKAWEDPNMRGAEKQAFVDPIIDKGYFETSVNGSTVTTVLRKVDKLEESDKVKAANSNARRMRLYATSTFLLPDCMNEKVTVLHTREMCLI